MEDIRLKQAVQAIEMPRAMEERVTERLCQATRRRPARWTRPAVAVLAAALSLTLAMPVLAAHVEPVYDLMYLVAPAMAQSFQPVRQSDQDNGVRMEVVSARIQGDSAQIYLTLQDLEGDRVDATTDLYDSYTIRTPYATAGHCEQAGYDADTGTALFLVTLTHLEGQAMPGDKITFSLREFLSQKEDRTGISIPADLSAVSTAPATQAVDLRGGSGLSFDESSFRALVPNLPENTCPVEGFTLTGLGWVEGKLHVQLLVDDLLDNDNHAQLYLTGSDGTVLEPEAYYSFWAEDESGDSYEEYIFSLSPEEAAHYRLTGDFFLSGNRIQGNWKVTFPLEG